MAFRNNPLLLKRISSIKIFFMDSPKRSLDISNPEHIRYQQGALDITILGGIRLEGLDRMRVTMKIQVEHLSIRHNLDLYNDNQVETEI